MEVAVFGQNKSFGWRGSLSEELPNIVGIPLDVVTVFFVVYLGPKIVYLLTKYSFCQFLGELRELLKRPSSEHLGATPT